jgi:hypothetical protein
MKTFVKFVVPLALLCTIVVGGCSFVLLSAMGGRALACNFSPDPSLVLDNAAGVKIGSQPIDGEQIGNAQVIVQVGADKHEDQLMVKLELMVAIQESHLYNLHYGDHDSLGLLQQRASWGTVEQRLDPTYASTAFYNAAEKVPGIHRLLKAGKFLDAALLVQKPSRAAYLNPDNYFPGWAPVADLLLGIAPGKNHPGSPIVSPCEGLDTGIPGKVIISAGPPPANLPGKPIRPETITFLARVAGIYGKALICTTGTNHSYLTASGNVSDHVTGHACDFGMVANGGSDNSPVGDAIAAACLIAANDPSVVPKANALGAARSGGLWNLHYKGDPNSSGDDLRIQCIWKAPDHYDHVHIGARPWQPGDVTGKVG